MSQSLRRKFVAVVAGGMAAASLTFLLLFVGFYRSELADERARASQQVADLLQVALENAMLKRDLDGLRAMVALLGRQANIRSVMILDPEGEVRFASRTDRLFSRYVRGSDPGCAICHREGMTIAERSAFMVNELGTEVLRSVNPVRNKAPCVACHGSPTVNPFNGVLVVDYDAEPIKRQAARTALFLAGSGGLVLALVIAWSMWFLGRHVLRPVRALSNASRELADGRLEARVRIEGDDELARLGGAFNHMADALQASLREVREKESFLQNLIDADPDGIRVIGPDFTMVTANRAYAAQVGQQVDDLRGVKCYVSSHRRAEPCVPTLVTCPVIELKNGGEPIRCMHVHRRSDGGEFSVEYYAAPLVVERQGKPVTLVIEAIRDLASELKVSQEQRLSEVGQLAAGVAHEIRNPLASARLGLQGALRRGRGKLDDEIADYLATVDGQIDRCIEVTERLLRLVAPPSPQLDPVSLRGAVEDVASLLSYEAAVARVEVARELGDDEIRVIASDSDIRMLILNLMQNAFHAMPEGGKLTITCRRDGGKAMLAFTDTGVGIPPDDMPNIFFPFFSRRADGRQGTGLGLTICRAIVTRFGGTIEVASEVGAGSTFTVILPSASEAVGAEEGVL